MQTTANTPHPWSESSRSLGGNIEQMQPPNPMNIKAPGFLLQKKMDEHFWRFFFVGYDTPHKSGKKSQG